PYLKEVRPHPDRSQPPLRIIPARMARTRPARRDLPLTGRVRVRATAPAVPARFLSWALGGLFSWALRGRSSGPYGGPLFYLACLACSNLSRAVSSAGPSSSSAN